MPLIVPYAALLQSMGMVDYHKYLEAVPCTIHVWQKIIEKIFLWAIAAGPLTVIFIIREQKRG